MTIEQEQRPESDSAPRFLGGAGWLYQELLAERFGPINEAYEELMLTPEQQRRRRRVLLGLDG